VNICLASEEGAHSPSWSNSRVIIIICEHSSSSPSFVNNRHQRVCDLFFGFTSHLSCTIVLKSSTICDAITTIGVNTSRAPEEGAHSPSWPNVLIIILINHHHMCAITISVFVTCSPTSLPICPAPLCSNHPQLVTQSSSYVNIRHRRITHTSDDNKR
jgi:hypothetical protein